MRISQDVYVSHFYAGSWLRVYTEAGLLSLASNQSRGLAGAQTIESTNRSATWLCLLVRRIR